MVVPGPSAFVSLGHTVHVSVGCFGTVFGPAGGVTLAISGVGPTGGSAIGSSVGATVTRTGLTKAFCRSVGSTFAATTFSAVITSMGGSTHASSGKLSVVTIIGSHNMSEGTLGGLVTASGTASGSTTRPDSGGLANKVVHSPVIVGSLV